ncbi:hypothetical protein LEP48_11365 [Isoptericola sp. NEAU-Y5]|uniref:Malto-oligosyltrehalose trehalohydrolase n=1 Tax=Isoptericola luteus TaxID=2879484 RepID=A0ABS7ZG11_9MICO|nr:hypothetical protein [Isoptericola sp. NEAU-Y5]MCA5893948.1 hypothetical protein [Isoptericola sp. NEAU-Y5]
MTAADPRLDDRTELGPPPPEASHRDRWPGARPLVWAPRARTVEVVLPQPGGPDERRHLRLVGAHEPGYWRADEELPVGTDYLFSVDGGSPLPDPCSPLLPAGPHGPSRVFDPDFAWTDQEWRGTDLSQVVTLHVDLPTFTAEGTLDAARAHLGAVAETGVSAVELSPVAAFDPDLGPQAGVRLFAVHGPYGGPRALQRFVDAAHGLGLAVVLDLPHRWAVADSLDLHAFGPYAAGARIGPRTGARPGPVGSNSPRINLDGSGSRGPRDFLIADAERWFRDFHVDGLLLDVDALVDRSPVPFLGELAESVRTLSDQLRRPLALLTDGPGRSDRLTGVVHGILASPQDPDRALDLRRLAEQVFPVPTLPSWRSSSHRSAQHAAQRASSVVIGDLTRLPAAAVAVPWSRVDDAPEGAVPSRADDDARACLLTFAILAGSPPVLDTEHVPIPHDDDAAERLVRWTRDLIELRPGSTAEVSAPVEVPPTPGVVVGRRGGSAIVVAPGSEPARLDLDAVMPVEDGTWQVVLAWDPDGTRNEDGVLTLPPRSPAVVRVVPQKP